MPQLTGLPLARRVDTKPSHTTHLTGTVSGLCELYFEQPLSTSNEMANQRNFFHLISASCTGKGLFCA